MCSTCLSSDRRYLEERAVNQEATYTTVTNILWEEDENSLEVDKEAPCRCRPANRVCVPGPSEFHPSVGQCTHVYYSVLSRRLRPTAKHQKSLLSGEGSNHMAGLSGDVGSEFGGSFGIRQYQPDLLPRDHNQSKHFRESGS